MICQSVYATAAEIPDFAKADFEQRADGKFYLKPDAIPGAAELLNPGLEANRARWQQQKEAADGRATAAETRAANAEAELSRIRTPGAVVLSGDDARAWQTLSTLPIPVKEIPKAISTELPDLRTKVARGELEKSLREISEKSHVKINGDVLADWLSGERGKGLKAVLKPAEVDDGKGGKVTVQMPFIVKSEPVSGSPNTFKETETALIDFAKSNLPSYLVTALETPAASGGASGDAGGSGGGANSGAPVITGSVRLPNLGGGAATGTTGATKGGTDANSVVDGFNAARDTRKNPLSPTQTAAPGATAGQGAGQG
jgi:hypothetical protein